MLAWRPATFDHDSVVGSCSNCHNGSTAIGKPSNHFGTTLQCDSCHSTTSWTPTLTYQHTSGAYPGNHRGNPSCTACHTGNSQTVIWPYSAYQPDCAGCHANRFPNNVHLKVQNPRVYYTVSELRNCAGSCHTYTDNSMTTISRSRSGHHSVSSSGF